MRNGLAKVCEKKYCLYCVKNCYNFQLKKSEVKFWNCVFCSVS